MKRVYNLFVCFLTVIIMVNVGVAQERPQFTDLQLQNEQNPAQWLAAKQLAMQLGVPLRITTDTGELIEIMGIHQDKPIYGVIVNRAHPTDAAYILGFDEVKRMFDLEKAHLLYGASGPVQKNISKLTSGRKLLLVTDWTADKVIAFDPVTGNLVDSAFIQSNPVALASPKEARMSPWGFITVSDQITDLVQKFDTAGTYISHFAPAGGVNNAILDNIRGHAYRPNNNLVVTVASGANTNGIAEFDSAGNYLGNFVANGAGGLSSPFGILFRANDVLITTSSGTQGVYKYNLDGTFNSMFTTLSTGFLQQIIELNDKRIALANFSGTGIQGVRLYDQNGVFLRVLTGISGNRGVYHLPNGNFLTTNGAGLHELDSTSGALVRTIFSASSLQYINYVDLSGLVTTVSEPGGFVPGEYALEQNYPNPFNPSTTIRFRIPVASKVILKVYDMLGREVANVVEREMEAGSYEVKVDGSALSSGTYIYRLGAGNFVQSRKLVLMK